MSTRFEHDPEFHPVPSKAGWRRRITLVDVVLILAASLVLIALLLPASRSASGAARRAQCTNNLKQIALGLHGYSQAFGALPPAYTTDSNGRPLQSWRTLILPYMEQEALYRSIDLTKPWNDPVNARALAASPAFYSCPAANVANKTMTCYFAVVGQDAAFQATRPRPLAEITDEHGQTFLLIEVGDEHAAPWMAPIDASPALVQSLGPETRLHHPGGMNAAYVDGSVRFFKSGLTPRVRRALITIAGGEKPSPDEY